LILDARARHRRGVLLAATGILIISPDGLLFRMAGDVGLWNAAFLRTLAMGVGLGVFLLLRHRQRLPSVIFRLGWSGLACAMIISASNIVFVGAFSHTTIANTLLMLAVMPLFSAVIARVFIAESIRRSTWVAIIVAIIGVTLIIGGGYAGGLGGGSLAGDSMALAASLLIAANLVILRRHPHIDGVSVLCVAGLISAAIAWPFADPGIVPLRSAVILIFLGGVIIPVALALMFRGTHYLPAAEVALFSLIETVLGPLWTWLGVGEAPSAWAVVGGAVVVAAIVGNVVLGMRRWPSSTG
jgi:drug/metabolite transporter (DMT)-like permease